MEHNLKKSPKKQQLSTGTAAANNKRINNSSAEDLSLEERYVLSSGKRQEPQGEEYSDNKSPPSHSTSSNNNNKICNNPTSSKKNSRIPTNSKISNCNDKDLSTEQNPVTAAIMKPAKKSVNTATASTNTGMSSSNSTSALPSGSASTPLGAGARSLDFHLNNTNKTHESERISFSSSDEDDHPRHRHHRRGDENTDSSTCSGGEDGETGGRNRNKDSGSRDNNHRVGGKEKKYRKKSSNSSSIASSSPSHSKSKNMSLDSTNSGHSAYNTLIIHHNSSSLLADTWLPANHEFTSLGMGGDSSRNVDNSDAINNGSLASFTKTRNSVSPSLVDSNRSLQPQMSPNLYENIEYQGNSGGTSSELSDIPRDYMDQLTVLKHLAKDLQQEPSGGSNLKRSESFSRSQPDLSQQRQYNLYSYQDPAPQQPSSSWQQPSTSTTNSTKGAANGGPGGEEPLPSVQILEILMRENSTLKAELLNARRKIHTINKLETELGRLQVSHAALFESAERRESLERSARVKLSTELKRLTAVNHELMSSSGSLQNLVPFNGNTPVDLEALKKEVANKDSVIAQLITQNKELAATKERQEIELAAQRATLAEQRTHIEILDSALTNAQTNVLRLEEECRKKQEYVDKVSHLQRAMSSLQLSNDKREQSDKKIRSQLEGEISDLKSRLTSLNGGASRNTPTPTNHTRVYQSPPPYPGTSATPSAQGSNSSINHNQDGGDLNAKSNNDAQLQQLQEKLKASEEQIYHLNSQVAKWENVFSAADFHPKHSQSNASTPNSWTRDGGANNGNGGGGGGGGNGHFFGNSDKESSEDLQNNFFRVSDLEWKIKDLESRLLERDAVIRILQTGNSNVSSPTNRRSPIHFSSLNSSNSSSTMQVPSMQQQPYMNPPPNYRESPSYSQGSTALTGYSPIQGMSAKHHGQDGSSGNLVYGHLERRSPSVSGVAGNAAAASAMYAKMGLIQQQLKSESEPPSYANLPLKLRLGGSGSSLMKNSNESLQHGLGNSSVGSGNSPAGSMSGPGSVSSTSGVSASGNNNANNEGKSIDDQLKELDTQLLSKGGPGTLEMQNLCCLPGFINSATYKSQKTISKSLLESLSNAPYNLASTGGCGSKNPMSILGGLNIMPPKPPSTYHTQHHGSSGGSRTNSGPPFMTSTLFAPLSPSAVTATTSLSNSVDSVLTDSSPGSKSKTLGPNPMGIGGGNVFTPVIGIPKGLPPKIPSNVFDSSASAAAAASAGKSRSLERNKTSSSSGDPCAGKYTVVMIDGARCRSLDRKELKKENSSSNTSSSTAKNSEGGSGSKKAEKESKSNLKSSVSSKAAFFGQLLTRRSPSPSREKKDKDSEKSSQNSSSGVRFPFSGNKTSSSNSGATISALPSGESTKETGQSESEVDAILLDRQGRSSQSSRNRISSKWSSSNTLESVEEQSGSESPWVQRKAGESTEIVNSQNKQLNDSNSSAASGTTNASLTNTSLSSSSTAAASTTTVNTVPSSNNNNGNNNSSNKKWGRIVKTPFGLRYTFGSPRVIADNNNDSCQNGPKK